MCVERSTQRPAVVLYGESAIDNDRCPIDVRRSRQHQAQRRVCDFFWLTITFERDTTARESLFRLVGDGCSQARVNSPRTNTIDCDALGSQLDRECTR